jgi:hypothetical protein
LPTDQTLPDPAAARKPARRVRRLGLYIPFGLAIVLATGWSIGWFALRGEAERRMDEGRAKLAAAGYPVSWSSRRIDGFPFRFDLHMTDLKLGEPSGLALTAPTIEAEAFAYSPDLWVILAPKGVTFVRPRGGAVAVRAGTLRASLSHLGEYPPRLSVEAADLTFTPADGASPYFITAAKELHLHLRAGPDDQGAVYVELDQATARLSGLLARIAQDKPINITADAIFSHAARFTGADWPSAVRAWSEAGGQFAVRRLLVAAGESILDAHSGTLSVGDDGRLRGSLQASLRRAPQALAVMGASGAISPQSAQTASTVAQVAQQGDIAHLVIDFQAGETTLGPASIGPAPRVY